MLMQVNIGGMGYTLLSAMDTLLSAMDTSLSSLGLFNAILVHPGFSRTINE
jgi:hypothetical protein